MADEKVAKLSLKREEGFTYWIKAGAVWRKKAGGAGEEVAKPALTEDKSYLYFLDADGDIARRPKRAKPTAASSEASSSPLTFADAFTPLRAHVGKAAFATFGGKKRAVTVLDWSELDDEEQAFFAEAQLYELAKAGGRGWAAKQVPIALVGGESHPVPLDELDQQTDGVLLVDLASGTVVYCDDATSKTAKRVADSTRALNVTVD